MFNFANDLMCLIITTIINNLKGFKTYEPKQFFLNSLAYLIYIRGKMEGV